jgi:hypothetical protein
MHPLPAKSLSGEARSVEFAGAQPTVLYYFSPNCHWCERNWSNVRTLAAQTRNRYRFIGISTTDQVSAYLAERDLSFETVTGIPESVLRRYGIGGTPRTIVISQQGRVLGDWLGAYSTATQLAVERFFGVSLPGLLPEPVVASGS